MTCLRCWSNAVENCSKIANYSLASLLYIAPVDWYLIASMGFRMGFLVRRLKPDSSSYPCEVIVLSICKLPEKHTMLPTV